MCIRDRAYTAQHPFRRFSEHNTGLCNLYADRILPVLPGIRDYSAYSDMGKYAYRSEQLRGDSAVLVEMGVPGTDFWHLHHCHKSDGRRSQRCSGPEIRGEIRR